MSINSYTKRNKTEFIQENDFCFIQLLDLMRLKICNFTK